ncbi:MAG: hypothetical protein II787_02765, partial [Lachnospiraceae bacterium]|nr:hypothetical protein [Lachnospiraceae bacterium]
ITHSEHLFREYGYQIQIHLHFIAKMLLQLAMLLISSLIRQPVNRNYFDKLHKRSLILCPLPENAPALAISPD